MPTITLEDHEALVLFDFLQREIDDRKERRLVGVIDHPSEFWVLNTMSCALERLLEVPFREDYAVVLTRARERIMFECDPEGTYPVGAHE
jgi:hypothetical protein